MSALPTMLAHLPLLSTNLLRRLVCALLLLQIFAVVLAVGLIIIAFLSLRVKLSPCAVMWLYDIQFIDITTIPVLCLHPIIVSRLFILAICK